MPAFVPRIVLWFSKARKDLPDPLSPALEPNTYTERGVLWVQWKELGTSGSEPSFATY